jgi:hypothetical protein
MRKRTECKACGGYWNDVIAGAVGTALFLGLLFLGAIISESRQEIMSAGAWTARVCLLLGALLCGMVAGGRAGQRKLLHAMAAEGVLFAVLLLCAFGCGKTPTLPSLLIDLAVLLFGAFAGTLRREKGRVKRRVKR